MSGKNIQHLAAVIFKNKNKRKVRQAELMSTLNAILTNLHNFSVNLTNHLFHILNPNMQDENTSLTRKTYLNISTEI